MRPVLIRTEPTGPSGGFCAVVLSHPKLQFAGLLGYTGAGVNSGHHVKNCLFVGGKEGPSEPPGTRLPVHQDTTTYAPKDSRQDSGLSV
jgi:hypothetical protein